ncbi:MAG: TAXI family TRAP transporter solute-binding subunit [Candidatus Cloacimonetes bacterium]|nr:TAXI family TRAP transporter solute-binding subunit [Candidatus Cloacimonadota bacterium]
MKFIKFLLILSFACLLSGCKSGPDQTTLTDQIQQKLDQHFKQGLFKVETLTRQGSYPFSDKADGSARLLIYFQSTVKFLDDYNLSDWNQLNSASLSSILGTAKNGIKDINPSGNKKDDAITIFGTSTYKLENSKWTPIAYTEVKVETNKNSPEFDEAGTIKNESPAQKDLRVLTTQLKLANKTKASEQLSAIEKELIKTVNKVAVKLDKLNGLSPLVSGPLEGEYYALGKGLSTLAKDDKVVHHASQGSFDNALLINSQHADFGIVQNDIASMAANGVNKFADLGPQSNLRAVCSLYPEAIQIITLKKHNIDTVKDLLNKRINLGPQDSGTKVNALNILAAHNYQLSQFKEVSYLNRHDAIQALKDGKIDAFFSTFAYPARQISNLAAIHPLKFVTIEQHARVKLKAQSPYYVDITIPKNTYLGMDTNLDTLGVTATLVTHKDVAKETVAKLLTQIFTDTTVLKSNSTQAPYISIKTAQTGISIPLHEGAKQYYSKNK